METFEVLLGLLAACVALALVARRLHVPLAVVLVVGGMALALVPGLPTIEFDPQLALVLFLPPLLQASAYRTDWPAFRSNLRPILLLAVGAVLFTAAVVAATAKLLVPDLPWAAAVALGAIVAPPDAVAAASVLKNFRIPKRIVTVLEGESLLNDASSLVLYRFAVAATSPSSPGSPPTLRQSTCTSPACSARWPAALCSASSSTRLSRRARASSPRRSGASSSSCSPPWCSSSSACSCATCSPASRTTTLGSSPASASPFRRR